MIHLLYKPAFPLSQFIECFWFFEGKNPPHSREKLLPDGAIEMIINLTDDPKNLYEDIDTEKFTAFKRSWISGERTKYIVIDSGKVAAGKTTSLMGARFKPGGLHPFFNFPVAELNDRVIELNEILNHEIDLLREEILFCETVQQKFIAFEKYLVKRAKDKLEQNRLINFAVNKILHSAETLTIQHLTEKTGYSQKHLASEFSKKVGLTPKLLLRIVKFQRVLQSIESKTEINWLDIVYDGGYYDQSHFIKEFQAFSGINPSAYILQRGQYLNYLPIN